MTIETKKLEKILYAEDEPDIRAIAKIALEDIGGFTVQYCGTGQEVLDAIQKFTPDLLLLDVMMPNMDGPTALKAVRKLPQFATTPAIFMTAKIQSNEVESYRNMDVIDIIAKPFDPMILAMLLNTAWDKWIQESTHGQ